MAYIRAVEEDKAVATAELGTTSQGRRITRTKTFYRPKNVSKARWIKSHHRTMIDKWEEELRSRTLAPQDLKLDHFVELWEKEQAVHLRKITLDSYKDQLERVILPELGHLYLSKINPLAIQRIINKRAGEGLSQRTVKYPLQVLSSILSQAQKWGYITSNPCSLVEIPPIPKEPRRKHYESQEVEKLIALVKGEDLKYQAIFYLALSGGLRKSEVLNLTFDDVKENGVEIRKGKNESSVRFVSLDKSSMVILRLHLHQQRALAVELDYDEPWLFAQIDGEKMHTSTPTQWLRRLCERNNIYWAGFHGLRHTSATLLISSGVDIKTVSSRIGHNQTSTTIDIYAHVLKEKEEEASRLLGEILHHDEKSNISPTFSAKKAVK